LLRNPHEGLPPSKDAAVNINGKLDVSVKGAKHLIDLLFRCNVTDNVNHQMVTPSMSTSPGLVSR